MTFGESVLRLVRGPFLPSRAAPEMESLAVECAPVDQSIVPSEASRSVAPAQSVEPLEAIESSGPVDGQTDAAPSAGPTFSDIEAAVALVEAGLARRVVLSNFPTWPGLLWRAYQLAEAANVTVMPTVVRPGGRVDIVVTREKTND